MFRQPFNRYGRMSPWREMERMRREMEQLFSTFDGGASMAPAFPAMNVWTNPEGAVVTAELPGVSSDNIDISVVGQTLTVSGSRQPEGLPENAHYHRRERNFGQFTRTFELPFPVESDKVEATFDKGVLYISLPRAEADKPRKITIKSGK